MIKDTEIPEKYGSRDAVRAVLWDENQLVPLLFVSRFGYHKLPGGGIELGEDQTMALNREVREEVGAEIEVQGEVGRIVEYRSEFNLLQTSDCYFGQVTKKGKPAFELSEIEEGFKLIWLSLEEAINKVKQDKPQNYEGKFIQQRDLVFLLEAKRLMKR